MRIFTTGGYGFIGSNFIIEQINKNNKILNFDKLTYAANQENLSDIDKSPNYIFINGDIKNRLVRINSYLGSLSNKNELFIYSI